MVNEDRNDNRYGKIEKNSATYFVSSKFIKTDYYIIGAKKFFNLLWNIFIKALIFHYFDSKSHINIRTNNLDHAILSVLSQISINFEFDGIL